MKKILSILLLCGMMLSLAACGNSAQEQPEAPQQSETPVQSETPAAPEQPSILPAKPDQDVITVPDTTAPQADRDQLIYEQLCGPGAPGTFPGWPQLGNRTLVDALAAIGDKLGIDGFKSPLIGDAAAGDPK